MAAVTLFWNTNMAAVTSCEYSLTGPSSFEGWPRDRAKSSKVINENEMTGWGKTLYQPGLMHVITEIRYTILLTPVTNKPMLWSMTSSILCFRGIFVGRELFMYHVAWQKWFFLLAILIKSFPQFAVLFEWMMMFVYLKVVKVCILAFSHF